MNVPGNVGIALGLTLLAGLSTGIGSALAYFIRGPKVVYLSFSLGLSAGVMVYLSFINLRISPAGPSGLRPRTAHFQHIPGVNGRLYLHRCPLGKPG